MPIILGFLGSIFKDWRMILAVLVLAAGGVMVWKFKSLESNLNKTKEALRIEQTNNQTLRNNLDSAGQINQENANVIKQLEADKQRAVAAVSTLNADIKKTNQSIDIIKQKINAITAPPTKLTPYLIEAVKGVQELRDAENPPTAPEQTKVTAEKTKVTIPRVPQ